MRAVKAKAARRLAQRMTEGLPARKLINWSHSVKKGGVFTIEHQIVNDPKSTRGVYRKIKNILKHGASFQDFISKESAGLHGSGG